MSRTSRRAIALVIAVAITAVVGIGAVAVGAKSKGRATHGTVWIAVTPKSTNKLLYIAGESSDKVLGPGAITYKIKPLVNPNGTIVVKALKVTLWTANGSLTGTGTAVVTITNKPNPGDATVSKGKASLTKGTSGQKGHSLVVKFTGAGNVSSGSYTFHYTGTYK